MAANTPIRRHHRRSTTAPIAPGTERATDGGPGRPHGAHPHGGHPEGEHPHGDHPDLAPGTGHFRLGIADGQALVGALRGRVSGLCQPSYVLDIPGGYGKVPIAASAAGAGERPGCWVVEDSAGRKHPYPPASPPADSADSAAD